MNVFIYRAALYCEDCGKAIRKQLVDAGQTPDNPDNESSYNSDDFPKGPYPNGGGESNRPQYCSSNDQCINVVTLQSGHKIGAMLENPIY